MAEGVPEPFPESKSREELQTYLRGVAEERGVSLESAEVAQELDRRDQLATFRKKFAVPTIGQLLDEDERDESVDVSEDSIYLCGNSLGLQPCNAQEEVERELVKWREKGVRGHKVGEVPWYIVEDFVVDQSAKIVGCKPLEVTAMNSLTVNIHFALASFYQPTKERYKILMEDRCFPSDHFAVKSQIRWHGYDPESALIRVPSRQGELLWRTEDIVELIEKEGETIALVFFSGIHYATGHLFDMEAITTAAHNKGIYAGFDLAHAAGNVELRLHDWGVDFALWCSYKYMNAGPGGISGFYIHEKHAMNPDLPRLQGWWSHNRDTRLEMGDDFEFIPGAKGFHVSNPPVLQMILLKASLHVFSETSMEDLCRKSHVLTGYLEMLIEQNLSKDAVSAKNMSSGKERYVTIVTSQDPAQRGCQLSLQFSWSVRDLHKRLCRKGVVCDLREPVIMRVAPAPLYNSFKDVQRFYKLLENVMQH